MVPKTAKRLAETLCELLEKVEKKLNLTEKGLWELTLAALEGALGPEAYRLDLCVAHRRVLDFGHIVYFCTQCSYALGRQRCGWNPASHLAIYLPTYPSTYLPIYLTVHLPIYLS